MNPFNRQWADAAHSMVGVMRLATPLGPYSQVR